MHKAAKRLTLISNLGAEVSRAFLDIITPRLVNLRNQVLSIVNSKNEALDSDGPEGEMELEDEQEQEEEKEEEKEEDYSSESRGEKYKRKTWRPVPFLAGEYFDLSKNKREPLDFIALETFFEETRSEEFLGIFNAKLMVSPNFLVSSDSEIKRGSTFFTPYQKRFNNLLLVVDRNQEILNAALIDREDASLIRSWLDDRSLTSNDKAVGLVLYKFGIGFIAWDRSFFADHELPSEEFGEIFESTHRDELNSLLSEVRFLSGRIVYSDDERIYLKTWFQRTGPERMRRLFLEVILKYRQTSRLNYDNFSDLKLSFDSL